MALCPNVYRRGTIYWWRRRFVVPTAKCYTLALSMGIRAPRAARILGAKLNAEAGDLVRQIEAGMTTMEEGRRRLETTIAQTFMFAEGAFAEFHPRPIAMTADDAPSFTAEQERAVLLVLARETEARFTAEAIFNRSHAGRDDLGQPIDIVATAVAAETALGFIYKFIGERCGNARLDAADRAAMAARGLSDDLIGFVERELAFYGRREIGTRWQLGPNRAYFEKVLAEADVTATDMTMIRLRRAYLALCAEILFDAHHRYEATKPPIADVLAALRGQTVDARAPIQTNEGASASFLLATGASPVVEANAPSSQAAAGNNSTAAMGGVVATPAILPGSPVSFIGRIETLATRKTKAKRDGRKDGWDEKTASQHLSIARLFTKMVGHDDARAMNQAHVGGYRDLLDQLPKSHGKSDKDAFRSLIEMLARCEDLEEHEVGLAGGTINRHLTQLGNCLDELRGHGCNIGVIEPKMRADDTPRERAAFSREDRETLFSAELWTGEVIIHDPRFFVPVIGDREVMRLGEIVGLSTKDVDVDRRIIHVKPNAFRGVKSKESIRNLPIMPELERIGFCDYIELVSSLGFDLAFPDLRLRGAATALSHLFYKPWAELLRSLLPNAQSENKSFHSFRKTGNSVMAAKNINDPLRHQILGHAYTGVNGQHYTDELPIDDKRAALAHIPVTTALIRRVPIRLHDGLLTRPR